MERFEQEGTHNTPTIKMDAIEGLMTIEGRSNPENAKDLYQPVMDWLSEYINQPAEKTDLRVNLEHFNTSSSKFLLEIFRKIRYLADNEHLFNVTWMYEEDDHEMLDTAEAYEMMTGLRFEKVPYPETHR